MGPANFRKIAGEFRSEFRWRIFLANFSACFSRISGPPKNSRPEIVGIPLNSPKIYSRRFSAYWGDQLPCFASFEKVRAVAATGSAGSEQERSSAARGAGQEGRNPAQGSRGFGAP